MRLRNIEPVEIFPFVHRWRNWITWKNSLINLGEVFSSWCLEVSVTASMLSPDVNDASISILSVSSGSGLVTAWCLMEI